MIGSVIAFGYLQYHPWAISERCRRSRQSYEEVRVSGNSSCAFIYLYIYYRKPH
jgi:hypothetical protein